MVIYVRDSKYVPSRAAQIRNRRKDMQFQRQATSVCRHFTCRINTSSLIAFNAVYFFYYADVRPTHQQFNTAQLNYATHAHAVRQNTCIIYQHCRHMYCGLRRRCDVSADLSISLPCRKRDRRRETEKNNDLLIICLVRAP